MTINLEENEQIIELINNENENQHNSNNVALTHFDQEENIDLFEQQHQTQNIILSATLVNNNEGNEKVPIEAVMMSTEEQENLVTSFNKLVDCESDNTKKQLENNQLNENSEEEEKEEEEQNFNLRIELEEESIASQEEQQIQVNSLIENIESIHTNEESNPLNIIDGASSVSSSIQQLHEEKEEKIDEIVNITVKDIVSIVENCTQSEIDSEKTIDISNTRESELKIQNDNQNNDSDTNLTIIQLDSNPQENTNIQHNEGEIRNKELEVRIVETDYEINNFNADQNIETSTSEKEDKKQDENIWSSKSSILIEKINSKMPKNSGECIIIDDKEHQSLENENTAPNNKAKALSNKNNSNKLIMTPLTKSSFISSSQLDPNDNKKRIIKKATIQKTIVVTTVCIYEEYYDPIKKKVIKNQLDKASEKSIISEHKDFRVIDNYEKAIKIVKKLNNTNNLQDKNRPSISSSVSSADSFYSVASEELLADKNSSTLSQKPNQVQNDEIVLLIKQEEQEPSINESNNLNEVTNKNQEETFSNLNTLPTQSAKSNINNNKIKKKHFATKKTTTRRNFLSTRYDNNEDNLNDNYVPINVILNDQEKIYLRNREIQKLQTSSNNKTRKPGRPSRRNDRVNSVSSNGSNSSYLNKSIAISQRFDFNSMKIDLTPKIIPSVQTTSTTNDANEQQDQQVDQNVEPQILSDNQKSDNNAQQETVISNNININSVEYQINENEENQQHHLVYSGIINNDLLLSTSTNKNDLVSSQPNQSHIASTNLNKSWLLSNSQLQHFVNPNQLQSASNTGHYIVFDDFLRDFGQSIDQNNLSAGSDNVFMSDSFSNNFGVQNEVVIEYTEETNNDINQTNSLNFNFQVQDAHVNNLNQSKNIEKELIKAHNLQRCSIKLKDITLKYKNLLNEKKVYLKPTKTTKLQKSRQNPKINKKPGRKFTPVSNKKAPTTTISDKKLKKQIILRKSPRKTTTDYKKIDVIILSDGEETKMAPKIKKTVTPNSLNTSFSSAITDEIDLLIRFDKNQIVFAKQLSDNNFYPAQITRITNGYSRHKRLNERFYDVKFLINESEENKLKSDEIIPIDILDKNDKVKFLSKNNNNQISNEYMDGTFMSYAFQHDDESDNSEGMFVVTCKKTGRNLTLRLIQLAIPKRSAESLIKRYRENVIEDIEYQTQMNQEYIKNENENDSPISNKKKSENKKRKLNDENTEQDQNIKEHNQNVKLRKLSDDDHNDDDNSSRRSSLSLTTSNAVGYTNQPRFKQTPNKLLNSSSNLNRPLFADLNSSGMNYLRNYVDERVFQFRPNKKY